MRTSPAYAGNVENLGEAFLDTKLDFVEGNILDAELGDSLIKRRSHVVHFAAESHVDRRFDLARLQRVRVVH